MNSAIEISELTKSYGNKKVLNGIDFEVKEGEIFGLLGPNGAGKTTTLECIEGLRSIDGGSITVFGEKYPPDNPKLHKILGVQLQSTSLPKHITAKEALNLFCKWQGVPFKDELFDIFGLNEIKNKQYYAMSTGQKRRLHLSIAAAHSPKILILDEPTAGLDVEGRISLHKEIRKLKETGVTIILASHDMAETESLCDRVAILLNGQIAVCGSVSEITNAGDTDSKLIIKTEKNSLLGISQLKYSVLQGGGEEYGIWKTNDIPEAVCELLGYAKEAGDAVLDLRMERPTLEEQFVKIIEGGKTQ